jgi:signal transduction histidine kinase
MHNQSSGRPTESFGVTEVGHFVTLAIVLAGYAALGYVALCWRRAARASREREAERAGCTDTATQAAVAGERERIARELHDIVAHSVMVMVLHAAGARRLLTAEPAQAGPALAQIVEQGQLAMQDLRRMLHLLRTPDGRHEPVDGRHKPPGGEDLPSAGGHKTSDDGQHSLTDVDQLVDRVRRAGVPVRLEIDGAVGQVPPSLGLTAYRVVQESLTNIGKHAGPGTDAVVRLIWADDLLVQVSNDRRTTPDPATVALSTGHGLLGLRERVARSGGCLDAGPTPGGGFQVTATLPLADHHTSGRDLVDSCAMRC